MHRTQRRAQATVRRWWNGEWREEDGALCANGAADVLGDHRRGQPEGGACAARGRGEWASRRDGGGVLTLQSTQATSRGALCASACARACT